MIGLVGVPGGSGLDWGSCAIETQDPVSVQTQTCSDIAVNAVNPVDAAQRVKIRL